MKCFCSKCNSKIKIKIPATIYDLTFECPYCHQKLRVTSTLDGASLQSNQVCHRARPAALPLGSFFGGSEHK